MKNSAVHSIFTCLLFCSLISTGCSGSTPAGKSETPNRSLIQIQDSLDRLIKLPEPAKKVVSLSPANTEIIFFVGAGSQLVGRETFSDYPEEAKSVPDIGDGMGGVNLEAILAVKPDLVLAGDLTPPEQVKSLEDVGLTVFVVPNPKDFSELFGIIQVVARLTGHESSTVPLIENLEARLNAVRVILEQVEERPLVFYEIDGTDPNAPWTAGPGSFIDMIISEAGGDNLGASLSSEWAQISIEELIIQDPDLILLGDTVWGGVTLDSVRARSGWSSLSAVQKNKLFAFDDNLVSRPGPRLIDGLEGLAKIFHPEFFN